MRFENPASREAARAPVSRLRHAIISIGTVTSFGIASVLTLMEGCANSMDPGDVPRISAADLEKKPLVRKHWKDLDPVEPLLDAARPDLPRTAVLVPVAADGAGPAGLEEVEFLFSEEGPSIRCGEKAYQATNLMPHIGAKGIRMLPASRHLHTLYPSTNGFVLGSYTPMFRDKSFEIYLGDFGPWLRFLRLNDDPMTSIPVAGMLLAGGKEEDRRLNVDLTRKHLPEIASNFSLPEDKKISFLPGNLLRHPE